MVVDGAQKSGKRAETAPNYADWDKVWTDTRNDINAGKVPAEQALKDATAKIDRIIKGS